MKPRAPGPSRCPRRLAFTAASALATTAAATLPALAQEEPDPPWFSTRIGGSLERIVVAPDGDLVVAGWAWDTDLSLAHDVRLPSYHGDPGLFLVTRLAPDGRPKWTTFVPAIGLDDSPTVRGLALAPDGSVWVAAYGALSPGPDVARYRSEDGIVMKLSREGALAFAIRLGGSAMEWLADVAVLPDGDAVAVGTTTSRDFLTLPPSVETAAWRSDAFVARIRADGAGIVWGRRFGARESGHRFVGASVEVDPADGAVLVTLAGGPVPTFEPLGVLRPLPDDPDPGADPDRTEAAVLRLDAAGSWEGGARLRFPVSRTYWNERELHRVPLAIDADGSVLVAIPSRVVRLPGHLAWIQGASKADGDDALPSGVLPLPGGASLVAEFPHPHGRISRLDADLSARTREETFLSLGFTVADAAVDAAGVLHVVGTGPGVSFHALDETAGPTGGYVARVPLSGGRPPSDLRVRALRAGGAAHRWSADGDAAVRHEIERISADAAPEVVGQAGGAATSLRLPDLLPGARHELRVVAVFGDGRRAAGPLRELVTFPEPPHRVSATRVSGGKVEVAWDDPNGADIRWQVQRRIGGGPWRATRLVPGATSLRPSPWLDADTNPHTDLVPDVAVPIRWRVRAVQPGRQTRWVESADLLPAPALRVVPKSGVFGNIGFAPTLFVASGTLAALEGPSLLTFSPATQEVRLLFGAAELPLVFVIPAGDPGWAPAADGVLRWSAGESLNGWDPSSEIVLDLAAGRFDVSLRWPYARPGAASGSVVFNLTLGSRSGGHVGTWRRSSLTPMLVRLGAPQSLRGSR